MTARETQLEAPSRQRRAPRTQAERLIPDYVAQSSTRVVGAVVRIRRGHKARAGHSAAALVNSLSGEPSPAALGAAFAQ
jgi:hypothetical protein